MKLQIPDMVAKKMIVALKLLQDEGQQPLDPEVADVVKKMERAVLPSPGQPLTAAELDAVAGAVEVRIEGISHNCHNAAEHEGALLKAALPKLELMAARQREREEDAIAGRGATW